MIRLLLDHAVKNDKNVYLDITKVLRLLLFIDLNKPIKLYHFEDVFRRRPIFIYLLFRRASR